MDFVEAGSQSVEGGGIESSCLQRFFGQRHLVPEPGVVFRVQTAIADAVHAHVPREVSRFVGFPGVQIRGRIEGGAVGIGGFLRTVALSRFRCLRLGDIDRRVARIDRGRSSGGLLHHEFEKAHVPCSNRVVSVSWDTYRSGVRAVGMRRCEGR